MKFFPFVTRENTSWGRSAQFQIRIRSQSRLTASVRIAGFTKNDHFEFVHTASSSGNITTSTFSISDVPVFLIAHDKEEDKEQGSVYVQIDLMVAGTPVRQLATGFVGALHSVSWPDSTEPDPIPGRGLIKSIQSANPAAGAEASITVTVNRVWHILSAAIKLVTSATVANRRVHLQFSKNEPAELHAFSEIDQTASQTIDYAFGKYGAVPDSADNNQIIVPIPHDIWLFSEATIATETTNIQVGDNFGTLALNIEEFPLPVI